MTNLTYSGDNNFNSENNIKDNLLRIFIIYSLLKYYYFKFIKFIRIKII